MITVDLEAELAALQAARLARIRSRRQARAEHAVRRRHGLRARHARRLQHASAGPTGGEQEGRS